MGRHSPARAWDNDSLGERREEAGKMTYQEIRVVGEALIWFRLVVTFESAWHQGLTTGRMELILLGGTDYNTYPMTL